MLGRRETVRAVLPVIFLDVLLPYLVFFALSKAGVPEVAALSAGAAISIAVLIAKAVSKRRLDKLAAFILLTFVIGIAVSFLSGDPRVALLRESVYTGVIGLVLLASLLAKRPLLFQLGQQFTGGGGDNSWWEQRWRQAPSFRSALRIITAVWGGVFLLDALLRLPVVWMVPVDTGLVVSPLIFVVALIGLIIWTRSYIVAARRKSGQVL
ncbi:MAG: DUF3159 domain-containing protein [Pseudonocardiales bacterium]|nr:DUF3159 domain-containing protein [Pseudonocardiales bacterium]